MMLLIYCYDVINILLYCPDIRDDTCKVLGWLFFANTVPDT